MLIENAMDNKPKPLQHGRQGLRTFSALVCLLLMTTSLFAQEKTVTGTVTDWSIRSDSRYFQWYDYRHRWEVQYYRLTRQCTGILVRGNGEARCESRQPACDKCTAERGLTNAG